MSADAATAAPAAARTGKATPSTKTQAKPNTKATKSKPKTRPKPKTKWGDREGRRRDILDAARAQMGTGGYLALNMHHIHSPPNRHANSVYNGIKVQ